MFLMLMIASFHAVPGFPRGRGWGVRSECPRWVWLQWRGNNDGLRNTLALNTHYCMVHWYPHYIEDLFLFPSSVMQSIYLHWQFTVEFLVLSLTYHQHQAIKSVTLFALTQVARFRCVEEVEPGLSWSWSSPGYLFLATAACSELVPTAIVTTVTVVTLPPLPRCVTAYYCLELVTRTKLWRNNIYTCPGVVGYNELLCAVELQTKVLAKVCNHREGPY